MGCRSDYLEPTKKEIESQQVAKHIEFVKLQLKLKVPDEISKAAYAVYGNQNKLDEWTKMLCDDLTVLKNEKPKVFEKIVYNAHDGRSRDLASWFEKHIKIDEQRIQTKESLRDQQAKAAKEKLSAKEFEALKDLIIDEWKASVQKEKTPARSKKIKQ